MGRFSFPPLAAAGQSPETSGGIGVEAIPKERKELLGLLLDGMLFDVVEAWIVWARCYDRSTMFRSAEPGGFCLTFY